MTPRATSLFYLTSAAGKANSLTVNHCKVLGTSSKVHFSFTVRSVASNTCNQTKESAYSTVHTSHQHLTPCQTARNYSSSTYRTAAHQHALEQIKNDNIHENQSEKKQIQQDKTQQQQQMMRAAASRIYTRGHNGSVALNSHAIPSSRAYCTDSSNGKSSTTKKNTSEQQNKQTTTSTNQDLLTQEDKLKTTEQAISQAKAESLLKDKVDLKSPSTNKSLTDKDPFSSSSSEGSESSKPSLKGKLMLFLKPFARNHQNSPNSSQTSRIASTVIEQTGEQNKDLKTEEELQFEQEIYQKIQEKIYQKTKEEMEQQLQTLISDFFSSTEFRSKIKKIVTSTLASFKDDYIRDKHKKEQRNDKGFILQPKIVFNELILQHNLAVLEKTIDNNILILNQQDTGKRSALISQIIRIVLFNSAQSGSGSIIYNRLQERYLNDDFPSPIKTSITINACKQAISRLDSNKILNEQTINTMAQKICTHAKFSYAETLNNKIRNILNNKITDLIMNEGDQFEISEDMPTPDMIIEAVEKLSKLSLTELTIKLNNLK